jgi:hypothetical protein
MPLADATITAALSEAAEDADERLLRLIRLFASRADAQERTFALSKLALWNCWLPHSMRALATTYKAHWPADLLLRVFSFPERACAVLRLVLIELKHGRSEGVDPSMTDSRGRTPLHLYCVCVCLDPSTCAPDPAIVRALIAAGVDPKAFTHANETAEKILRWPQLRMGREPSARDKWAIDGMHALLVD